MVPKYFVCVSIQYKLPERFFSQLKKTISIIREIKLLRDVKPAQKLPLSWWPDAIDLYLSKLQNLFVQVNKYICPSTNHISLPPSQIRSQWWWRWIRCWSGSSIFTSGRSPLEGTAPICYQINKHFPFVLIAKCICSNSLIYICSNSQICLFKLDKYLSKLEIYVSKLKPEKKVFVWITGGVEYKSVIRSTNTFNLS